jgi:hypothetical protein
MRDWLRQVNLGAVILGGLILLVGVYYFLVNTLGWDLAELDWDAIWPVAIIALGVAIVWGALVRRHGPTAT